MTSSSRPTRVRAVEGGLAALGLLLTWLDVWESRLPAWWDFGVVTLPPASLYPVPLAALVLVATVGTYRRRGTVRLRRLATAALATLVVATALLSVYVLNTTSGGVFFAGMPPVVLGVLLSVAVSLETVVVAVTERTPTS